MASLNILISIIVPLVVFVVGLHIIGYSDIIRLCLHLITLYVISRSIIGLYNILAFKLTLNTVSDRLAHICAEKNLPPLKKYGYFADHDFELKKWYGQTYLEDIADDADVDKVTRLEAKILVSDIHKAEKFNFIREIRLMKLALVAMIKYHKLLERKENEETMQAKI